MAEISVIVPVYNVEKYLPICLNSILEQTFCDIEVIVVDDGSKDSSSKICDEYAKNDARIQVIHKENGGLASARQSGFECAMGKFIFFIDSDDCIHPETLERLHEIAIRTNAPVVQCDLQVIEEDDDCITHELHERGYHKFSPYNAYCVVEENDENLGHNSRLSTTVTWGKLIRKDVLDKVLPIEPIRVHEDQLLITRLLSAIDCLVYLETDFYYYRNRSGSIMKANWNKNRLVILDIYEERFEIIEQLDNVSDLEKEQLKELIYKRYMIAMIRNCILVRRNIHDSDRKPLVKSIEKRFQKSRNKEYEKKLKMFEKCFFSLVCIWPMLGMKMYAIIKRDM